MAYSDLFRHSTFLLFRPSFIDFPITRNAFNVLTIPFVYIPFMLLLHIIPASLQPPGRFPSILVNQLPQMSQSCLKV